MRKNTMMQKDTIKLITIFNMQRNCPLFINNQSSQNDNFREHL